jgi:glycerol-3-phosphate O-acyltransferase/dihydroxyacetone phosphate acyltransferase
MLPKSLGSVSSEILEIISDEKVKLKKEFAKKATEGLKNQLEGVKYKVCLAPPCLSPS